MVEAGGGAVAERRSPPAADAVAARLPDFASVGPFGYCTDKFLLATPPGAEILPCAHLCRAEVFCELLDRYALSFAQSDRRAVASLWTLYYFSLLTITPTVCRLVHGRRLALAANELSLAVEPTSGQPVAFVLAHAGCAVGPASAAQDLHALLRDHVAVLVPSMAKAGGLSPRLLWNNAAVYLAWILRQIGETVDAGLAGACLPLVEAPLWPDGGRNPMAGLTQNGARRVCCLRYMLPSIGGCGASCPLPCGRKQEGPQP